MLAEKIKEPQIETFKHISFVGCGYNLLKLDPRNLGEITGKKDPVFALDATNGMEQPLGETFLIPKGTSYSPENAGSSTIETALLYSGYEFQSTFNLALGVDIGIPGLFSFSLSGAYQKFQKEVGTTTTMKTYTSSEYKTGSIKILQDDIGDRLPLTHAFTTAIHNAEPTFIPKEPQRYFDIIEQFGTHYAKQVTFGGRLSQDILISKETYQSLTRAGINIEREAKGTFEGVTVGEEAQAGSSSQETFDKQTKNGQSEIHFSGGVYDKDLTEYIKSVKEDPTAIEFVLDPLS
ncbi:MAG: MAC/perforin domain-containing protein, partial [Psychrosphaera sp.]|nr:MAC/perforin domain-containing protein [Psychrosphaera sp.]